MEFLLSVEAELASLNPVATLTVMRIRIQTTTGTRNGPNIVTTWNNKAIHAGTESSLKISFLSGLQNTSNIMTYAQTNDHTCTG